MSGCGGVEEVVRLLGDGEARCRSFAADCISSMAADGRQCIQSHVAPSSVMIQCLWLKEARVTAPKAEELRGY